MSRLKSNSDKQFYSVLFFIFFIIYSFAVTSPLNSLAMSKETYVYHLVDFSMGFCSKILPGAIYNFLFDNTYISSVHAYCLILLLAFVFIVCILLEKFIKKADPENKATCILLSFCFISGISIFPMYVYVIGTLDSYWTFFTVLSVICLFSAKLYIFIVPLSLMVIMVNFGSITSYIPFIILLLIYKSTVSINKKEKFFGSAVAACVLISSACLAAYLILGEFDNLTYSFEEFSKILNDRGYEGYSIYYGTALYREPYYDNILDYEFLNKTGSPIYKAFLYVWNRFCFTLKSSDFASFLPPLLNSLPFVLFIAGCLKGYSRKFQVNKAKKLVFSGVVLMFFATLISVSLFSADVVRFISHAFTTLLASFLFIGYYEGKEFLDYVRYKISKIPKLLLSFYLIFYFFSLFEPVGNVGG